MAGFGNVAQAGPRMMRASLTKSKHGWNASCLAATTPRRSDVRCASVVGAGAASKPEIKKTNLYDLHVARGAKMMPFAGYSMPIQYAGASIAESHHFTRKHASLFDVSHMVQHMFMGPRAAAFLEKITPSDWKNQGMFKSKLTTLLWPESGGIVDDCVITRMSHDFFFAVTNGACFEKDCSYLDEELRKFGNGVRWLRYDDTGMIALQGPQAAEILKEALEDPGAINLDRLYFGDAAYVKLRFPGKGGSDMTYPALITRGGYTGEDGFEIALGPPAQGSTAPIIAESLLEMAGPERLQLAGLGARDSLRLEAGMCLYGHDLDDTTTPVEAGLSWIIPKERRHLQAGFHGAEIIIPQLTPKSKGGAGVSRRRVGFLVEGAPAREGADIQFQGQSIGTVTSGVPSPTLGKNIAMGYIKDGMHKAGTEVDIVVRGRNRKAVVTKMPFVPTRYYKPE
ncbi:hypothetical protein E4U55_004117 [Claviceps digitariae]|nr:hypothetical protein E4U55_004117 [Claviceps digitariae]